MDRRGFSDEAGALPAAPAIALPADVGDAASRDAEILDRVRGGDEQALMLLYDRYGEIVLSVAMRILGDRELAQEVLQDTFLRCWHGAEQYRAERGRVGAWLTGIARNRAIDMLRSHQHQARLRERSDVSDAERLRLAGARSEDESELLVLREVVGEALAELSTQQRQVLELAYYGGMTQSEIAQALGEPLGTVKTRTRTALSRMRNALRPYFDEP